MGNSSSTPTESWIAKTAQGAGAENSTRTYERWRQQRMEVSNTAYESRKQAERETIKQVQVITDKAITEVLSNESTRNTLLEGTEGCARNLRDITFRPSPADCEVLLRSAFVLWYPLSGTCSLEVHSARRVGKACEFTISTRCGQYSPPNGFDTV